MNNKIPCIKCTPELWEYIKSYLEKWGYSPASLHIDVKSHPLLVINAFGNEGKYNLDGISVCENHNRELITNVEEFLERAAKLKGFTYKRKDMKEPKVFYMIFAEGERTPAIKHSTLEDALKEAKRIAQRTGNKTYVLKAVKSVMVSNFIVEDLPEAGNDFDIDCK